MKTSFSVLIAIATLALPTLGAPSPSPVRRERIEAAYLLGLGRPATSEEIERDAGAASLADMVDGLRKSLQDDRAAAAATARHAARDALGSEPDSRAIADAATAAHTYAALVKIHLQHLSADPAEYRAVIDRAYHRAVRRAAHDIEVEYWMRRDTLPFIMIVACIENWARRNAPGLMSTTGTPSISMNSAFLTAVRLSPGVAHEARALIGFDRSGAEAAHAAEVGYHIVAPGAEKIVSIGGVHFIAIGQAGRDPASVEAH